VEAIDAPALTDDRARLGVPLQIGAFSPERNKEDQCEKRNTKAP